MKNKTVSFWILILVLGLAYTGSVIAKPLVFRITPGSPNRVEFKSEAKMETIIGFTDKISGALAVDPGDLSSLTKAEFTVDMTSLDTDNSVRNGHMRSNHLHTDKYPTSHFVLKALGADAPKSLPGGNPTTFSMAGDFTCHGVTREIAPKVIVNWHPATRTLDVVAQFDVLLADYQIPRPQFLVLKLDERQQITVSFTAMAE